MKGTLWEWEHDIPLVAGFIDLLVDFVFDARQRFGVGNPDKKVVLEAVIPEASEANPWFGIL